MSDSPEKRLTKQELYTRIREKGMDETILSEMVRLGFWPKDKEKPVFPEALAKERLDTQKRLNALTQDKSLCDNPEAALKKMHKERKEKALKNRERTRQENNERRFERAKRWHELQSKSITYLGEGIHIVPSDIEADTSRLEKYALPILNEASDLSNAMGVSINELRFLCFQREVSKVNHYQQFFVPKKTGGKRKISAPMPRLKRAQYWMLDNILEKIALSECAHGFVKQKGIVSNAEPHVGKKVVINLDLEDFFPTITFRRVKGMFKAIGYGENIATLLACIATETETESYNLDGETWHIKVGEPVLPQGAPSSPALSNILCKRMDARLQGMSEKLGFTYTRYADDLSFSSSSCNDEQINQLLWRCRAIVTGEGFSVHPEKTQVMRRHQQQEVTGIVVNDKLSVDRKTLKRFRALLFQIDKDGPVGKAWGNGELFNTIEGYANYVAMVNPDKGIALQETVAKLKRKYGYKVKPGRVMSLNKKRFRLKAARGEHPRDQWWQATAPKAPVLEETHKESKENKRMEAKKRIADVLELPSNESQSNSPVLPGAENHSWPSQKPRSYRTIKIMACIGLVLFILLILLLK